MNLRLSHIIIYLTLSPTYQESGHDQTYLNMRHILLEIHLKLSLRYFYQVECNLNGPISKVFSVNPHTKKMVCIAELSLITSLKPVGHVVEWMVLMQSNLRKTIQYKCRKTWSMRNSCKYHFWFEFAHPLKNQTWMN